MCKEFLYKMTIQSLLSKAGLENQEIELYLALVKEKTSSAGRLAMKSGIKRTYAYPLLSSLMEKGLVRQIDRPRSIREYAVTDFDAPKRFLDKKQTELMALREGFDQMSLDLKRFSEPSSSIPAISLLKNREGEEDFWKLLHSTISREIWIMNPPAWWENKEHSSFVHKWQIFREKQRIWEKRVQVSQASPAPRYTEIRVLKSSAVPGASMFLIDQYQVQVFSWDPFFALRIESSEIIPVLKAMAE